jgi:glycerophosphoryl diester phosphodiesterase
MMPIRDFVRKNDLFVVAHRGSSGTAPENTIAAFQQAIDSGVKMVEMDIMFTSDGEIVAFHDLEQLTKVMNSKNFDFSYKNLKELDAGSWFDGKFAKERIPLFRDILKLVRDKVYLLVEIKTPNLDLDEKLISAIVSEIEEHSGPDQVTLASFNHQILAWVSTNKPGYPIAAIKLPGDERLPSEIAKVCGAEGFICSTTEMTHEIANDCRKNGLYSGVYSVDDEEELEKMLEFDISAIATNYPAKILALLDKKS